MEIGSVTIEGSPTDVSGPTLLYNETDEDWLPHAQFLDEDGMPPFEMGGLLVQGSGCERDVHRFGFFAG